MEAKQLVTQGVIVAVAGHGAVDLMGQATSWRYEQQTDVVKKHAALVEAGWKAAGQR
jgi:hypothetical protein